MIEKGRNAANILVFSTAAMPLQSHLPFFHVMAGLGAPDTSHLRTAVIPSVTVVSTGRWVKAGAISVVGRRGVTVSCGTTSERPAWESHRTCRTNQREGSRCQNPVVILAGLQLCVIDLSGITCHYSVSKGMWKPYRKFRGSRKLVYLQKPTVFVL